MIAGPAAHQIKYYVLAVSEWVFTRAGPIPAISRCCPNEPRWATIAPTKDTRCLISNWYQAALAPEMIKAVKP